MCNTYFGPDWLTHKTPLATDERIQPLVSEVNIAVKYVNLSRKNILKLVQHFRINNSYVGMNK